ncbi:MAG: riboflavin synthase [Candidatus Binataceae bacterium]
MEKFDEDALFTGIIEDLGTIERVKRVKDGARLTIATAMPIARISIGDSIAVSGCCLTVVAKSRGTIAMDVSAESLRRTILGELEAGDRVNLERCLTLGKLIGGHLVAGHVDGTGRVVSIKPEGDSRLYTFECGAKEARYLVERGSVTVDGISLTVFGIRARRFTCALIPHTLRVTTLGLKRSGDSVNVESDMLIKYVERIVGARRNGKSVDIPARGVGAARGRKSRADQGASK